MQTSIDECVTYLDNGAMISSDKSIRFAERSQHIKGDRGDASQTVTTGLYLDILLYSLSNRHLYNYRRISELRTNHLPVVVQTAVTGLQRKANTYSS